MASAFFVWLWLVIGLKLLSSGGAWQLGLGGALVVATLLWPAFVPGYFSLKRLGFGSLRERDDELVVTAWHAALGAPVLLLGAAWSVMVLGLVRFLAAFTVEPRGGVLNFVMSVLALHVLAWGATGATQWAWAVWRETRE